MMSLVNYYSKNEVFHIKDFFSKWTKSAGKCGFGHVY